MCAMGRVGRVILTGTAGSEVGKGRAGEGRAGQDRAEQGRVG